jgi:hypothetical protein
MSDLSVHPVYLSARAAIIAPERAIPVTVYAAQKWLPRLGPERWCLVILLRSLCIDTQRRSDGTKRIACSWRQLAEMLDVHEETVASWLKHKPIPNDKPWRRIMPVDDKAKVLSLFIPRLRYAYETQNGKTRRIGFLLEVLMDDPVVPEDETRLQKQMEIMQMQQGELGLETYRLTESVNDSKSNLPKIFRDLSKSENPDLHYVNQVNPKLLQLAKSKQSDLHNTIVNPINMDSLHSVKQNNSEKDDYVNQLNPTLPSTKSGDSGKNVNELDILIQQIKHKNIRKNLRKQAFEPIVQLTEEILDDKHSTGLFYKVLGVLYPERLDLYTAAVRVALNIAEMGMQVNLGAVFVKTLRDFAETAGVDLGLKPVMNEQPENRNPSSHFQVDSVSFDFPSADEAIWAETQSMLRRQMTRATYDAIIQGTVLVGQNGNKYIVGVQTEMAKEWLENRWHDIVQRTLSNVVGMSITLEFILLDGSE